LVILESISTSLGFFFEKFLWVVIVCNKTPVNLMPAKIIGFKVTVPTTAPVVVRITEDSFNG